MNKNFKAVLLTVGALILSALITFIGASSLVWQDHEPVPFFGFLALCSLLSFLAAASLGALAWYRSSGTNVNILMWMLWSMVCAFGGSYSCLMAVSKIWPGSGLVF